MDASPERHAAERKRTYHAWTPWLLDEFGAERGIARKGMPPSIQIGKRWVVERAKLQVNGSGKFRRVTDKDGRITYACRSGTRPSTHRLK